MRYTERLAEAGAAPSVGSVGDAYDNALAESVIGWCETEVIRRRGPWRRFDDGELATLEWVGWFNTQRLLEPLSYVPPAEFEAMYHETLTGHTGAVRLNSPSLHGARGGSVDSRAVSVSAGNPTCGF